MEKINQYTQLYNNSNSNNGFHTTAYPLGASSSVVIQIELEFRSVGFCGGGKLESLEKILRSRERTNNKLEVTVPTVLPAN